MEVDIVCTGFGPAAGGFLTTLSRGLPLPDGSMPQILCYERADDIGFGVSGVVTKARGIRTSFPDFDPSQIPMAAPVGAMNASRMRRPSGVRTGMFCRFGSLLESRPVTATACP